MGAVQGSQIPFRGPADLGARSSGQAGPEVTEGEHDYEPESSEESFIHYRRSFGLVWQAFRLAGHDRQLQPETVHHILKLADISPFESYHTEFGDIGATWRAVQSRHRFKPDQNELTATLAVATNSELRSIDVTVSSRDQGWVSDPNAGSWTWAELSWVDEEGQEIPGQSRVELFRNELEVRDWQEHSVCIEDPEFLSAQPGTRAGIALWIRSRFGGWQHYVRYACIRATYAPQVPWPGFTPLFRD